MTAAVVFDYVNWITLYPQFATVTQPQAQLYFDQACTVVPIDRICEASEQTLILNAATAHFVSLFASINGQPPRQIVGQITNAAEGSVSVQAAYVTATTDSQAFWNQTPFGAYVWMVTLKYRTGFYVPPVCVGYGFPFYLPRRC